MKNPYDIPVDLQFFDTDSTVVQVWTDESGYQQLEKMIGTTYEAEVVRTR